MRNKKRKSIFKRFIFKVEMSGYGKNVEEAWEDCYESFCQDPGIYPEDYKMEEEEEQ